MSVGTQQELPLGGEKEPSFKQGGGDEALSTEHAQLGELAKSIKELADAGGKWTHSLGALLGAEVRLAGTASLRAFFFVILVAQGFFLTIALIFGLVCFAPIFQLWAGRYLGDSHHGGCISPTCDRAQALLARRASTLAPESDSVSSPCGDDRVQRY